MRHFIVLTFLLLLIPAGLSAREHDTNPPRQSDLIIGLVEGLGWSFGLPDDPGIDDYLTILKGSRTRRFELEEIYVPSPDAPLFPKEIRTYGPFSGQVWQRAPAHAIEVELKFLLPLSGTYQISASLTKAGYSLEIGGKTFSADGKRDFSLARFGAVELAAGEHAAVLKIPPRGGIDYLLLEAPPAQTIAPLNGWSPARPLDEEVLAVVVSRTLDIESLLRPLDRQIVVEAETAPIPQQAQMSRDPYHGPVRGSWLKVDLEAADYIHLFEITEAGVYDLGLNILARRTVDGLVNGKSHFRVEPKPYFTLLPAGSFYLEAGTNQIEMELPPRSGFDRFTLRRRASSPEDYLQLTGLSDSFRVTGPQLDRTLQLLAAIGVRR